MIKIIADSTCDLSKELIDEYDISLIPLHIILGDEDYKDGVDITPEEIFKWSDENKITPKTSAPSIEEVVDVMKPFIEQDMDIISFSISNSMSASGNVMKLAAEELNAEDKITVIDSANLSTGIGLLVLEAATMAKEGLPVNEIVEKIEELKPMVRASFVVDTLEYLYRGGRCSGLAALAGGVLKLHPFIGVADGAMGPGKKYRGTIGKVIVEYAYDLEKQLLNAKKDRVFITHSGCNAEIVERVRAFLKDLNVFENIYETRAGGVISSHCGPGTLGVLFIANE